VREVLHLFDGQAVGIEYYGEWVTAVGRGGEDIDLLEGEGFHGQKWVTWKLEKKRNL
jgi:hypothetical protein